MPSRPLRDPLIDIHNNEILSVIGKTNILAGPDPTSVGGITGPSGTTKQLLSIQATESPTKQQDRTFSEVSVSFLRDTTDPNYGGVRIWFTGYKGNPSPVIMTDGTDSPITFLCETTKETVVVTGQTVSADGTPSKFSQCVTTTVPLDGVVSAPPNPSISQSLIGTSTGYQFAFNQVNVGSTQDVIDGYTIYRNTTGVLDGSQTKINYFKHNPKASGAIVVTDTIVPASASFYFYWVSATNTSALESTLTAAQSGLVAGAIGSIPPTISSSLTYASTTTSITWSWASIQCILRADGTITTIGAGTQAITGLIANTIYNFYPVYDEKLGTLRFLGTVDVTPPAVAGVTLNGTTGEITTTTSFVSPTSFTLEAWMKAPASGTGTFISHCLPQTGVPSSYISQVGIVIGEAYGQFTDTASASQNLQATTRTDDGNWHHVAYVVIGSVSHTLYVDGVQVKTATLTTSPKATSSFIRLGRGGSAPFTNGTQAYCAYYSTALNAIQVGNHFNALSTLGVATYNSTTLADSPTYQWYLNETTGTVAAESIAGVNTGTYVGGFVLNQSSSVLVVSGTPAIAWETANYLALQAQNLRNLVPLSAGSLQASTPISGSGGGGGGGTGTGGGGTGGGRCFSPNTKLKTQTGDVRFDELKIGDCVLTARNTWKTVTEVTTKAYKGLMIDLGDGELVTKGHLLWLGEVGWVRADQLWFTPTPYDGLVWNAHIEADDDGEGPNTEHSYTLSNGWVAHNVLS
jgi:hypothetical protein